MKVFVLDPHAIYRKGLTSCLRGADSIDDVGEAGSIREAWQDPLLREADVVVVDQELGGAIDFIRQLREATGGAGLQLVTGSPGGTALPLELPDVGARRERALPLAGHDDRPDGASLG